LNPSENSPSQGNYNPGKVLKCATMKIEKQTIAMYS
jgi:hypothetical protein